MYLMKLRLEFQNYLVVPLSSSVRSLEVAKEEKPDLILLDVKLPKISGFEILKRIKSDPDLRIIPVILLTTTGKKEDIAKGARLGTNDYIVKPVEYETFIQKVKGLGKYWALISNLTT